MDAYLLYCALLVLWVTLPWPAWRLRGAARAWLALVAGAGAVALAHEVRIALWTTADIRIDIVLIGPVLLGLYASAAVLLFVKRWRATAALLTVALALIGTAMGYQWILVDRESQRVRAAFVDANRLLFEAGFRSAQSYERRFGPFSGAPGDWPVGHWVADAGARFTRLIVNAHGRVWLFHRCQQDAECPFVSREPGLAAVDGRPGHWSVRVHPRAGAPLDVVLARTAADGLALDEQGRRVVFASAPPPLDPAPAPHALRYLGPFASVECVRAHATVRQVWLWRDGANALAVGVFSTHVAGRRAQFVHPVVMGDGVPEDGGWRFAWQRGDRSATARVALRDGGAVLTLDRDGRDLEDADGALLRPGGVFADERVALAPLTGREDWRHWFSAVLVGHFASGDVPPCPPGAAGPPGGGTLGSPEK